MQLNPIPVHLFHIRRAVAAAVSLLHDCSIAERKIRLEAHRLANVSDAETSSLAIARGRTFALRWRAHDTLIRAGIAFRTLCAEIDKSGMTTAQKLDLLGARHRYRVLPPSIAFARLVGEGDEMPPVDVVGTPDPRVGLLKAAGRVVANASFLEQHIALQPAVEAIETAGMHARDVASEWAHAASRVSAAGALAMPQASRIQ